MIGIIGEGILFGLLLAVMLGPVFFALIQTSIVKGLKSGIFMACGVVVADVSFIFLMYFSVLVFKDNSVVSVIFGAVGGLIMLITGIYSIRKKEYNLGKEVNSTKNGTLMDFIKGFVLNGINPFVLLYWLGVMTLVTVKHQYTRPEVIAFFCAIISTLIVTDMTKVFLAQKLRNFVTERRLKIMNRIVGVALILFSVRLFYFAYQHFDSQLIQ